jgi:hypothetical protein
MKEFRHMKFFLVNDRATRKGAALVVVLVILVLMLGIILAFFSQSILQKQVSKSSASQTSADLLAQGAAQSVISDLRREITDPQTAPANSLMTTVPGTSPVVNLYRPKTPANAAPERVGVDNSLPNLIKQSQNGQNFASNVPGKASNVASDDKSDIVNARPISLERWNKPLLMPAASFDKTAPPDQFKAPNWIYVDRSGNNPVALSSGAKWGPPGNNNDTVVGRYAYTIYNEGGLLDANVAGYSSDIKGSMPDGTTNDQTRFKSAASYADLTQLGLSQGQVDILVNWRNSATLDGNKAKNFFKHSVENPNGFLAVGAQYTPSSLTDKNFIGRQQLIDFFQKSLGGDGAALTALQYLGTFSRSLNQPQFFPDPNRPKVWAGDWGISSMGKDINETFGNSAFGKDDVFNPAFGSIRAQSNFTRFDKSKAIRFEPLVKKRFPLDRLAWISYKGPSADNMGDPVVQQMIKLLGGEPSNPDDPVTKFVKLGDAQHIEDAFGLKWTPGQGSGGIGGYWVYRHSRPGSVANLTQVAQDGRDPDFFELLKAGIHAGSIAYGNDGIGSNSDGTTSGGNDLVGTAVWQEATQVDDQIVQIGANIIDSAWPENFPTQIVFDDGFGTASFWGKVDLPYFYGYVNLAFLNKVASPPPPANGSNENGQIAFGPQPLTPGKITCLEVPFLWNPFKRNMPALTYTNPTSPTSLRISISNFNEGKRSQVTSSPFNFWNNFYPRSSDGTLYGPFSGNNTLYFPSFTTYNIRDWNLGSVDETTGTVVMPPDGYVGNTALYFDNPDPSSLSFREPTPLMRNLGGINLRIDPQNLIVTKGGYTTDGVNEDGRPPQFYGFYLGSCGQRFVNNNLTYTVTDVEYQEFGCTISLEYKSGSAWIPYHQIIVRHGANVDGSPVALNLTGSGYNAPLLNTWRTPGNLPAGTKQMQRRGFFVADPRVRRWFGTAEMVMGNFVDGAQSRVQTFRPSTNSLGDNSRNIYLGGSSKDMLKGTEHSNVYDADRYSGSRIARRAVGAYVPGGASGDTTSVGMPLAQVESNSNNDNNRPIILHRPFRSVAELGYVFTDTPWRDIDFFTPESGTAALLDVFCIHEATNANPMVAGKVDLNTRQPLVLQALLTGASRDDLGTPGSALGVLTVGEAKSIAQKIVDRTTAGKGFANISELVGKFDSTATNGAMFPAPYTGLSSDLSGLYSGGATSAENLVKRFREAAVRGLSDTTQAGTWNLLIDVVAQTGRLSGNAGSLKDFSVEGEKRYWVHVAVDRQTGKVIDQQLEAVVE